MVLDYKNILLDFRSGTSDLLFILRAIEFIKAYQHEGSQNSHSDILMMVINLCKNNKMFSIPKEAHKTNEKIYKILSELAYNYNLQVVRCLGFVTVKMLKKFFLGIYLDERQILQIRNDLCASPVVFMPTHRSYSDFILISFICFKYNINIPCVAAGKDFLSMWFINKILRKCKAFFMRRKFSGDPVYKNVFKEYIKVLISRGNSPIEFFIEGTRSRSGKSLMPKFGILAMLVDAYISGSIPDIKFIPINISYDRILEEFSFAQELIGIPKQSESTLGLLRGLKLLNGNYGNIFINFGVALSIRDFFRDIEDFRFLPEEIYSRNVTNIAFTVVKIQQNLQTFGSFSLIALIINSALIKTRKPIVALDTAVFQFQRLLEIFKYFGAYVFVEGEIEELIKKSIITHSSFVELSEDRFIRLKLDKVLHSSFLRSSTCQEQNLTYIPYMLLQIYINSSLSLFVRGSIIISILRAMGRENKLEKKSLFLNYIYLCKLLKNEFILTNENFKAFTANITHLKNLKIIELNGDTAALCQNSDLIEFFLDLIYPFLFGISSICRFIKGLLKIIPHWNSFDLLKMIKSHIEGQVRGGLLPFHYCASMDFISNTVNSLVDWGVFIHCEERNKLMIDNTILGNIINFLDVLLHFGDHFKVRPNL